MRQARTEELVRENYGKIDPPLALAMLRDYAAPGGASLPIGHHGAIDALVATHSVVADLTAHVLWVSEGPHTLGRFRRIELDERIASGDGAATSEAEGDLDEGTRLRDGSLELHRLGNRQRKAAEAFASRGRFDTAADVYRHAIAIRADDHLAWRELALVLERRGDDADAGAAWRRVLELGPESPAAKREAEIHAGR
jgi:tetratricopeptide (TPR) repeat protein